MNNETKLIMAKLFRAQLHMDKNYQAQVVYVEGVQTSSAAKEVLEARYPGAKFSGIYPTSKRA